MPEATLRTGATLVIQPLCAMTILCRHQTALLAAAVPGSFVGEVAGLLSAGFAVFARGLA